MELFLRQVQHFVKYLKVEKNASQHTVKNYCSDIERFLEFAKNQGVGEAIFANLNPLVIRAYLGYLRNEGYARHTIVRRIAGLRCFFRFLCREKVIGENPFAVISIPRAEKKVPVYLDVMEVNELLSLPGDTLLAKRDASVLELLYASGLKVSELTKLLLKDVDVVNGYLIAHGSGAKARFVPIGKAALLSLNDYLENVRPKLYEQSPVRHEVLFVNSKGGPLTDRSVRRMMQNYTKLLAFDKKVSPHTLRYAFAAHLLDNGADLCSVQELLGCINSSGMGLYAHVTREKINSVYKAAHPRA
jgi:integrase/recombinase XerC